MLKTKKNIYKTLFYARAVALLALFFYAGATGVHAQGYFTLTNGHYYWFDGTEIDTLDNGRADTLLQYPTGYDKTKGWNPIHNYGSHTLRVTTEVVEQGDTYMALDTSDGANPTLQSIPTADGFNPLCVWYRTGNNGFYYQEWDGFRYYLVASHSQGLRIYKVAVGQQTTQQTTWYDWDHGAAIQEEIEIPGGTKKSYYWIIYDTLDDATGKRAGDEGTSQLEPCWRMSTVNCYQRPDEFIYENYHYAGGRNTWNSWTYYDPVTVPSTGNTYPAGIAATFLPVQKTEHSREISNVVSGLGLTSVTTDQSTITYSQTVGVTAEIVTTLADAINAYVIDAYTEYKEETYRRGINLSSDNRDDNSFNRAGLPVTRNWYYYDGDRHDNAPSERLTNLQVDSVLFTIDSRASRYLTVTKAQSGSMRTEQYEATETYDADGEPAGLILYDSNATSVLHIWCDGTHVYYREKFNAHVYPWEATLSCRDIPSNRVTATITATVFYDNGTIQQLKKNITVVPEDLRGTAHAKSAPVIKGSVFGGGRMANVEGSTAVIVHNADSIYALYGGNDIAGWVQGAAGTTVQVGTRYTDAEHPVHIGWVYGGGCGYYQYGGVYDASTGNWGANGTKVKGLSDSQFAFRGGVYDWNDPTKVVVAEGTFDYTPANPIENENGNNYPAGKLGGTMPYLKKARVSIGIPEVSGHNDFSGHNAHEHNDHILIDSLFGGAENAFVGVTSPDLGDMQTAVDLTVDGGTILAAFGGNNYGGAIAEASKVFVNVNCTKLTDDESMVDNSYFHGVGRDFGIRHVFGGGNHVESSHAQVTFRGGMVDTAYIGGNAASVKHPIGIVDCRTDGTVYDMNGVASGGQGFTQAFQNGHLIYTNPTIDTAHLRDDQPNFIPDVGLYNVHFLYGGNNVADMENVSFVQLLSGGVGAVLGGGNMGDMNNDRTIAEDIVYHSNYIDIVGLVGQVRNTLSQSLMITIPEKLGSMIAASENSKILADYLHGGCRKANIKHSSGLYIAGGSYYDIFAGNDISGDVGSEHDGSTYTIITGDAVVHKNVYGGNDGYYHCDNGSGHYADNKMGYDQFNPEYDYDPYNEMVGLLLPTQQHTNVFVNGGLIKGDLVAGGVMANVGYAYDTIPHISIHGVERDMIGGPAKLRKNGTVRMEVADTAEIRGNVFGGGSFASIYGLSQVLVRQTPTILGGLFAGNDCIGSVQSFLPYQSVVDYTGCSNAADSLAAERANQAAQVSTNGDPLNVLEEDGSYNPKYSTYLRIEGSPIINSVYGSGNGAWDYDGTRPQFPSTYVCAGQEGNRPDQSSAFIDIHTSGGFIDTVFGGGNGCTVQEDVVVLLNNTAQDNPSYPASLPSGFVGGSTRTDEVGHNFVGTIFGGNNFSDMNTVPEIRLVQGNVKNVYGGGNEGNMTEKKTFYDICDNPVEGVSTHILSQSENVTVSDSVFGGCRMSDLEGMAYVEVHATSDDGIQYLYGGNDISGHVKGNARIDMAGGKVFRMWGGSNGRYDFIPVGYDEYNVYPYGTYDPAHPAVGLITKAGKPVVDSTNINLWGGIIGASVFTGGSMADCRTTCLVVDDQVGCPGTGHITVNGALYGGGEGRWDDLNARNLEENRWGNVTGSTYVHLYHADNVTSATAYGGGGGGDVLNTWIKTYDTWDSQFKALFGGCWGSDVFGTAHLEFNGKDLVKNLFGGNDFTGNVYRTEIVVNSGNFHNVFGGGNGDYPDSYYTSQHPDAMSETFAYQHASPTAYAGNKRIERPNTEYVHITFNDGLVDSCLYGGGKMGTILPYQKEGEGYRYEMRDTNNDGIGELRRYVPDTMRALNATVADPEDFSYVVLNVHGGKFMRNVFGGGRGFKSNKKPLVYGVKVVNMDGGEIYESLYGGSEYVNDGYPAECKSTASTTKRPSSIVNFTGGQVGSNLYGAGYQGMVYGSSYVNIGLDAIDSCTVWRNSYGRDTEDSTYARFIPGFEGGLSDALTADKVTLKASIYSGANWGLASGETEFNNPGFNGGESRLYIDGKGYNTTNDYVTTNPEMNIQRSIYGSGTSVLGGDVHSHVEIRNYGGMEYCQPTKTIETIQRADSVWLHNTAILLTGTTDASQQYMSNRYSMMNLSHLNYRGYNVTEFQAAVSHVDSLGFYEQGYGSAGSSTLHTAERFDTVEVAAPDINDEINNSSCGDNVDICYKEYMVSPSVPNKRHTLLILDNGVNLSIGDGEKYGPVTGYGYVTTPGGYQSTIMARPKVPVAGNYNMEDGGFVTNCDTTNKTRAASASFTDINTSWATGGNLKELPYTNHVSTNSQGFVATSSNEKFRVWKVGDKMGVRETEATLLAHTNPAKLPQDWSVNIIEGASPNTRKHRTGIAEAAFELPTTTAGHYYKLTGEGFLMQGSNGDIYLVDSAWVPNMDAYTASGGNVHMSQAMSNIGSYDPDTRGGWESVPGNVPAADMKGSVSIHQSPGNTFGLIMVPNGNFATTTTNSPTYHNEWVDIDYNYLEYEGTGLVGYTPDATTITINNGEDSHGDPIANTIVNLNNTRGFVIMVCDPEDDDDEGTFYWQAYDEEHDTYANTLTMYNMNWDEDDDPLYYNETLYDYCDENFSSMSCGDYVVTEYRENNQHDHYSYAYDMPFRRDASGNLIDANGDPSAEGVPHGSEEAHFVIEGNARVNSVLNYCSPKVYNDASNPELKPSMRLYLTYDTTFSAAFTGTVTFQLMEYDENGHAVAPINVKVYIQTIIEEFKDLEQDVIAMYNGGRTNTFTRKIELPPCGEERNLYITGIKWLPTNGDGEDINDGHMTSFTTADRFSLLGDSSKVQEVTTGYPFSSTDPDHSSHNRFALTIIPTNNMSEEVNAANGWIRGNNKRTNLYKLASDALGTTGSSPFNAAGTTPVKTLTWNSSTSKVDTISLRDKVKNDSLGFFVGTLDGRGSAVIDVELTFDGKRTYDDISGRGYVGKAVLTMVSIQDEDNIPRGTFHITIYVKTREHGDTIYIASANSVTRKIAENKTITLYPYNNLTAHPINSYEQSHLGKQPSLYVQTFRKALEEGIYQEGDVLCILDTVRIDSTSAPVHITGPNGPPIEVVRYDGHHHDLPDEQSVYRGPMIVVENGNVFTAQNIEFHGGAGAKIKKVVRATPGDDNSDAVLNGSDLQFVTSYTINDVLYNGMDKAPDTNMVWGPIFQVSGAGSTVELREGTIVNHNWNGYGFVNRTDGDAGDQVVDATGMPISTKNMGAISLTDGGTLAITGNVTVENNFGHTMTGYDRNLPVGDTISVEKAPGNGAIYVDGGTLELLESNRNTAITINNNYLMNPSVHESSTSWWLAHIINDKPDHYDLNPSAFSTWHKANVLLTREQAASASTQYEQIMNDDQSDVIVLSGTVGDGTKIGVRKWFPGVHERDTIQIAVAGSGNNAMLESAVENGNFVSDDDFRVFYNSLVNLSKGYLFRCATFRHQLASEPYIASVYDPYNVTIVPRNVLYFGDKGNVCPSGSDSIIYRIQGGLMPYTYTWSDPSKTFILSETTTPYSNAQVENDLGNTSLSVAERTAKYAASMADTLILPKEAIDPTKDRMWNHLLVTATDATGECILYKNIDLRIRMSHDSAALYPVTYMDYAEATYTTDTARNYVLTNYITGENWKTAISNGWTDTSRTVKAIASRNFKGIQITPRVWVDRLDGNITATVPGSANDYIYQYIDESTNHELTGLNFCPGDSIYLYTEPRDKSTKFIMWDFDPYYRQLALYIVPPHDATVTAYYGPDEYWHQHVNTATIADAIYDNNYYYPGNSGHGYVTTYHGDVHIYNENGLAWFISVVNGLNDVQARQFYFNKVYLHKKPKVQKRDELGALVYENDGVTPVMVDDPYDMKNYLWTPVGTQHQPFRGWFIGTSSVATDTTALTGNSKVSIKNIIVNEPHMDYTGFFGSIDTARISGISLESMLVRGAQYVGGLAASSKDAIIKNVAVSDDIEDNSAEHTSATTILSTHYTSGGLIGISNHDKLTDFSSEAKYVGDAVYSGGAVGYGTSTAITNSQARNDNRMSGLYIGGIAGYLDGTAPTKGGLFRRKSAGNPSIVMNNYVRLENSKGSRVGGIVGYAKNTQMENNYFYGDITGASSSNGVAAVMEGSSADGNYYQQDAAKQSVGSRRNGSTEANSTTFEGEGNNVTLAQSVNGRNNLTRVLNAWVREHNYNGGDFYTWRSDLDDANSGYPLFGVPNIIPVHDSMTVYGCDSVEWEGTNYNEGDSLTIHTVDNVEMIDSTLVIRFALHHSSSSNYSDSATIGQTYEGYGFTLTEAETALLLETMDSLGNATLVLRDTFQTVYGCDSVVTLTLYFSGTLDVPEPTFEVKHFVKVFPNPTASYVTIESDGMQHVEFYDNDGRRLQDYDTHSKDTITIDISDYSTGAYYLRIHSAAGVTIQKIVKL